MPLRITINKDRPFIPDRELRGGSQKENEDLYRLWWTCLRLSPTYFLAYKHKDGGGLSESEMRQLPSDFDQVLRTYKDFGAVLNQSIEVFQIFDQERLFGVRGRKPSVHRIGHATEGNDLAIETCHKTLDSYLSTSRLKENTPEVMLVSIPVRESRQRIFREIGALIDSIGIEKDARDSRVKPLYTLNGKRIHVGKIKAKLELIELRTTQPDRPLWKLGEDMREKENQSSGKSSKTLDQSTLSIQTSRAIKNARLIIENAARGRFPCSEPVELPSFDHRTFKEEQEAREKYAQDWQATESSKRIQLWKEAYLDALDKDPISLFHPGWFRHWLLHHDPFTEEERAGIDDVLSRFSEEEIAAYQEGLTQVMQGDHDDEYDKSVAPPPRKRSTKRQPTPPPWLVDLQDMVLKK